MSKKVLLIVDLQKEFSENNQGDYMRIIRFVRMNASEYDAIVATYFRQDAKINANFVDQLNWGGCSDATERSLEFLPFDNGQNLSNLRVIHEKNGYGDIDIKDYGIKKEDEIQIVGCDLEACIMSICFKLWDKEYKNVKILTEYCFTSSKTFTKRDVIKIMKRNFGKWVV